ncbi:hypothetical protein K2X89_01920 [Myxococcota bacterium]|nr:hypothetical protein [Myxococcota bacterium]
MAKVEQWNLGLSASAVAASLALETPHFATSLAAGAFLEAVNLGALRRSALRFFAGELGGTWTGAFTLRFLFLAGGIFLTLQAGAHPVALLIGLSIAMPAVLIDAWLNRPPILDPATLPVLLDEDIDDETREAAELAARDERLSISGSIFGSIFGRLFPTATLPTETLPTAQIPTATLPNAERGPESPGPDETRR